MARAAFARGVRYRNSRPVAVGAAGAVSGKKRPSDPGTRGPQGCLGTRFLRKACACFTQPVSFTSCSAGNWASFSAGALKGATVQAQIEEAGGAVAFAFVIHDKS